jgi:hypothetical protein
MNDFNYIDPFSPECNIFATQFDRAYENRDWNLTQSLITKCENFICTHTTPIYAPIFYSLGTAYGDLMNFLPEFNNENILEKMLFYYRKSISLLSATELQQVEFKPYINGIKLPLLTNYGNALEHCGRKITAFKCYLNAIDINPDFLMAQGNTGIALLHYSMLVHDPNQRDYLNHFAYRFLQAARNDTSGMVHSDAKTYFDNAIKNYHKDYINGFLKKPLEIPVYDLGNAEETSYRKWCLHNHIFLNPLNDLPLEHSCFAADTLQLPSICISSKQKEIPIYFGIFNQIKQEYIYARYLSYNAQQERTEPHFGDKETFLVNLYDYPQYSIRIEELKTSFRLLYSLFDRIAFFINSYWDLGIKERDINFNSIWFSESGKGTSRYKYKNVLNPDENLALTALKWIYKDFREKFGEAERPNTQKLKDLRNALEHKYVKVHSAILYDVPEPYTDRNFTYHISETDLIDFTMDLLYMIRESIIELSLAVHISERDKHFNDKVNTLVPKIKLFNYEDDWKI